MLLSRAEYLVNKLLVSELSEEELDEFLNGLKSEEDKNNYSELLELYFKKLLKIYGESTDDN